MSHCGDEKESNAGKIIQHSTINNLNYDCLAKIFRYLPLEQRLDMVTVCKHWKEALKFAWDDLGTSLNFSQSVADDIVQSPMSLMNNKDIGRLLKSCGDRVTEVRIGPPYSSRILLFVGHYCNNLRKLDLAFDYYDVKWSQFLPFLEQLESLKIKNFKRKFPQKFFNIVPETLVDIEIHSLRKNAFSATNGFMNLRDLRHLTLVNFSLDSGMIDAISQKPDLTHLNLSYCKISSEDLTLLFPLDNLQHLNLSGVSAVNDDYVIQFSDIFKHLKSLDLSRCEKLTDYGIICLRKLSQLEELNLMFTDITDGPLGEMHNLKILNCSFCKNVKDSGIIRLIRNAAMLEHLDVSAECKVTQAIIVEALEVTRRRSTFPLQIFVDTSVIRRRNLNADKAYSPLLVIIPRS